MQAQLLKPPTTPHATIHATSEASKNYGVCLVSDHHKIKPNADRNRTATSALPGAWPGGSHPASFTTTGYASFDSSCHKVFGTAELLENILAHVDDRCTLLNSAQRVDENFAAVIDGSPELQKLMFRSFYESTVLLPVLIPTGSECTDSLCVNDFLFRNAFPLLGKNSRLRITETCTREGRSRECRSQHRILIRLQLDIDELKAAAPIAQSWRKLRMVQTTDGSATYSTEVRIHKHEKRGSKGRYHCTDATRRQTLSTEHTLGEFFDWAVANAKCRRGMS